MNGIRKSNERKIINTIFGGFLVNNNSNDITNNYSSTATDFTYQIDSSQKRALLKNITVFMKSDNDLKFEQFGSISNALTNGVRIWYKKTSTDNKIYLDGEVPIKTTGDFVKMCFDVKITESGHRVMQGVLDFQNVYGDCILLERGGMIGVTLNDDLRDLDEFTFFTNGIFLAD